MSTAALPRSVAGADEASARVTFLKLLCQPMVTAAKDRDLYRDVLRHAKQIDEYCKRLEYRRAHLGGTIRLVRNPVLGSVIAPPRPEDLPPRRVLTLATLLAAACEEVEGGVTLVKLSDLVTGLSATTDRAIRRYDPDQLAERRHLVKAADLLKFWGVLRRRVTLVADINGWAEARTGIGAGYDVDREALLLFVNPDTIALAATQRALLQAAAEDPGGEDAAAWESFRQASRVVRQLRTLVETPGLLYADLPADEADLARTQRGLRADVVLSLLGGRIEARREGLLWVNHDEDCPSTMAWPSARTESWAALMVADKGGRDGERDEHGVVHLSTELVDDIVEDLTEWKGAFFRRDLREDQGALRAAVEQILTYLGLLTVNADRSWRLRPFTGRYRDPDLVEPDPVADDLFTPTDDTLAKDLP